MPSSSRDDWYMEDDPSVLKEEQPDSELVHNPADERTASMHEEYEAKARANAKANGFHMGCESGKHMNVGRCSCTVWDA